MFAPAIAAIARIYARLNASDFSFSGIDDVVTDVEFPPSESDVCTRCDGTSMVLLSELSLSFALNNTLPTYHQVCINTLPCLYCALLQSRTSASSCLSISNSC